MTNYLELNGAKVYPRGNAQITLSEHRGIDVSELIEITDGVIIETNGEKKFDLLIEPINVSENFVFWNSIKCTG